MAFGIASKAVSRIPGHMSGTKQLKSYATQQAITHAQPYIAHAQNYLPRVPHGYIEPIHPHTTVIVEPGYYQRGRGVFTTGYGLINGFSPIPPAMMFLPYKIGMLILFTILFSWLGLSFGKALLAAYLGQALIITFMGAELLSGVMNVGFGL
jgi:hypothetical protein